MNPLKELERFGQSIWLDYIRRNLIASGELKRLIEEDGLAGVTSNPAIFEKAISGSTDYTEFLDDFQSQGLDALATYERLAIRDIQEAADVLKPVYDRTNGRDGYVSLEVSPYKAADTEGTIEEAKRLWETVGRENLMVKVPATPAGIPAVERLIAQGVNVNVTLLFSQAVYERVAKAFLKGLEARATEGEDLSRVASVASFFISRIDTAVDSALQAKLKETSDPGAQDLLGSLLGKVAITNAKLAYERYRSIFSGERWEALADKGAKTQRLLWASTSAKNANYRDVMYVEELIGPDTVNTLPPATLDAFRDHGRPRPSLGEAVDKARRTMTDLEATGVSMKEVTDKLLSDGVRSFAEAFDKLLTAVNRRCSDRKRAGITPQSHSLSDSQDQKVREALRDWRAEGKVHRLWARDASLWTNADESNWLGWLGITEEMLGNLEPLRALAAEVQSAGFTHALLLGMGGSSLCPEVLKTTFGKISGFPELHVLDSTAPAQVRAIDNKIDPGKTLFIVSSKSGTTLEPNAFKDYFFDRVRETAGPEGAGAHFIAITDPGSPLEEVARRDGFRRVYHGVPGIGGRYSALSNFGMVPAAVMGMDVQRFLDRADEMAVASSSCQPPEENPAVHLGLMLGVLAREGRNKITIVSSPGIRGFGAWLEQLLAESTGKQGKALIPVDREPLGPPDVYDEDRVIVYVRLESAPDPSQDEGVAALERAGQPVIRNSVADPYELSQEFFRWEIATAVAGSMLGINPFDQPDVEASKVTTRALTDAYEESGSLPEETPFLEEDGIKVFTDARNAAKLRERIGGDPSLVDVLQAYLNRLTTGDYFALLAYLEMTAGHETVLQGIRQAIRDKYRAATCLGFGPRFLHSTGQAHKGGPNTGVFLQITCDDAEDLPIPGRSFTFGVVKAAQARGDFQVLAERDRRVVRVHLPPDIPFGLERLRAAIERALG